MTCKSLIHNSWLFEKNPPNSDVPWNLPRPTWSPNLIHSNVTMPNTTKADETDPKAIPAPRLIDAEEVRNEFANINLRPQSQAGTTLCHEPPDVPREGPKKEGMASAIKCICCAHTNRGSVAYELNEEGEVFKFDTNFVNDVQLMGASL